MCRLLENNDYRDWDWLPGAADEIEDYLQRLLDEGAIIAHDVTARHKSITSFQDKCHRKSYTDPRSQVTDCVAARIITYSITDRDRVANLIRRRFDILPGEDRLPGEEKPRRLRGYDCVHLVLSGEKTPSDWMVSGGGLVRYFKSFGGLEVQVRTVAAHAWAEFEHHVRYKGAEYPAIGDHDQEIIDQLFGIAADARHALDETFIAIERVLADPAGVSSIDHANDDEPLSRELEHTPIDEQTMSEYLENRFPDDREPTDAGLEFACALAEACDLKSIEALEHALDSVDGEQVRRLIATTKTVTSVRRLDDELLARYGEQYIHDTDRIGTGMWVRDRGQNLRSRFDRLRGKVHVYQVNGKDCPEELRGVPLAAARAVREVAWALADSQGADTVVMDNVISRTDDLPVSARSREIALADGSSIWVATNLNRDASEEILRELLGRLDGVDLHVTKFGVDLAPVG